MSQEALKDQDPVAQIVNWFDKAVPKPTDNNMQSQLGVHFEEVFEMTSLLDCKKTDEKDDRILFLTKVLEFYQREFKNGSIKIDFDHIDRTKLLDSICDQIVTAIGIGHLAGMDVRGALLEVAMSNNSKFDENGQPIFDRYHKIQKSSRYVKPALEQYTARRTVNHECR